MNNKPGKLIKVDLRETWRNEFLPKFLRHHGTGMPGREILKTDVDQLNATNILSRSNRLRNDPRYSQLPESYEILCELAHLNMLQNFLLTTYDEKRPKMLRWEYGSEALTRAMKFTGEPMMLASEGAVESINSFQAPFGMAPMVSADLV